VSQDHTGIIIGIAEDRIVVVSDVIGKRLDDTGSGIIDLP